MEEKNETEKNNNVKGKKVLIIVVPIVLICVIVLFVLYNNYSNNTIKGNDTLDNDNLGYDIKSYKVDNLYYEDFNDYYKQYKKETSVKYNDGAYIDGDIVIDNGDIYLKYEQDNVMQNKKINISGEKPKHIMVFYVNVVRYVYILTEEGNVYLNDNNYTESTIDNFLKFSKINNLENVMDMFKIGQEPYFIINNIIYNKYGEIAKHNHTIKSDDLDLSTATGADYYMQISNDGLLYKNIIKNSFVIGSPESANSILTHQKQENELYKNNGNENIYVSALFGINGDTYLVDRNGNYYKIEIADNNIKLSTINSKNVISVDKYSKSSIVQKIEINYSDGTKDIYSRDNSESIW